MSIVSAIAVVWLTHAAPQGVLPASPNDSPRVAIAPAWGPARVALADGDGGRALEMLTQDAPAGLRARALLAAGRTHEACAIALAPSLGARVHRLRCALLNGAVTAQPTSTTVARELSAEAVVVMRQAPALFVADDQRLQMSLALLGAAGEGDREAMAAALVERPASLFDRPARERIARLLQVIVDAVPAWRSRAATRLVLELPEHARPSDRAFVGPLDAAARIALATTLERQHDTQGVLDAVAGLTQTHCEAALLVGKSERKRKRFAAARAALRSARSASCSTEIQKKASFLEVRIAAVVKGAGAESLADAFIDRFGRDPLVDDVLLWLAEVRSAQGNDDGAAAALTRLVNEHTDGDMVDEARFRLAMHKASRGDSLGARALLDQTAQRTSGGPVSVMDHDRARYWSARLQAAPSPMTWEAGADVVDGVVALRAFAGERPASYYGRLAALAASHLSQHDATSVARKGAPPPAPTTTTAAPVKGAGAVTIPATLVDVPAFRDALACAEGGFDEDAAILLGEVAIGRSELHVATALAAAFSSVGRADLGHRALRDRGFALVPGAPSDESRRMPSSWAGRARSPTSSMRRRRRTGWRLCCCRASPAKRARSIPTSSVGRARLVCVS
jgi:hypothetical protein